MKNKIYLKKVASKGKGWCHDKYDKIECHFFNLPEDKDCPKKVSKICRREPVIFIQVPAPKKKHNTKKKA